MSIEILMPALSPTMTTGNLAKWHKKEGDKVLAGEVLAEIETDKATMEVEAVDEGIIGKIIIKGGTLNVAVNSVIAILLEEGEEEINIRTLASVSPSSKDSVASLLKTENHAYPVSQDPEIALNSRIFASPLAKRIANQKGLDLDSITGTGPYGRIIKEDVIKASKQESKSLPSSNQDEQSYTSVPNNMMRKIIATRLVESKQKIPHFYLSIECNVDRLLTMRSELNASLATDTDKISVNDLIVASVARSLKEVKEANASWSDEAIHYYNNIDISIAVAIDSGLITPILRNADKLNITSLSRSVKELVKKARDNKLSPEEFQGGGFTISNLGMYGIKNFQAIINPPQSCILAIGASSKRAVVINDEIKIATIMDVTLSCDHRVVDGVVGSKFLASFKKFIEQPMLILV